MITTPIYDFVRRYADANPLRLHMPGHKGLSFTGAEAYDITEVEGADSLYEASGIILESEKNAGALFGAETFYSTEGSSLCIRAMLYLAVLYAKQTGRRPLVAAGRNVHKSFLSAAALLDFDIQWLYPKANSCYLSCGMDAPTLETELAQATVRPCAVYLTSPDYLGSTVDIRAIADVCHKYGVLLLVDNAHGAYLKFLPQSMHPVDLGADLCCDSAHKTLPVLTGGAYLHIAPSAPPFFARHAKKAMALFGSTSPSYLILQSLDLANRYLAKDYPEKLAAFTLKTEQLKERLMLHGLSLFGNEPLKLTVNAKKYGYTGRELAEQLSHQGIVSEFSDPDFLVLMMTPETGSEGLKQLERALLTIPQKASIKDSPPQFSLPERVFSVREASFAESETIPTSECAGRILAAADIACPPAVPIVVCGERIHSEIVNCLHYYGIEYCNVMID